MLCLNPGRLMALMKVGEIRVYHTNLFVIRGHFQYWGHHTTYLLAKHKSGAVSPNFPSSRSVKNSIFEILARNSSFSRRFSSGIVVSCYSGKSPERKVIASSKWRSKFCCHEPKSATAIPDYNE